MKKSRKAVLIGLVLLALVTVPTAYSYQTYYSTSYKNNLKALRKILKVPLIEVDYNEFMETMDTLSKIVTVDVKYVGWEYFSNYIENKPADKYELFFDKDLKTIWARDRFRGKTSLGLVRIFVYKHNDLDNFMAWLRVQLAPQAEPL